MAIAVRIKIKIESKVGIAKVIYYWNEEERYEEDRSGNTYEKMIDIPEGENTLHVEVIDTKGQEKQTSETFINESSDIDPDDPTPGTQYSDKLKISTSITSDGKLKIVATSEEPMKYITYKWNEEEETTKYSEDEQSTSIETIIDVRSGLNTITITAEDIEGNINSVNKNFEGKFKPEIKVYKQDDKIYMKVSHYKGLKEIQYLINGNELIYDENYSEYDPEKTEVEFSFKLQEGENTVIIKATSNEDTQEEYSGSKTYHEQ